MCVNSFDSLTASVYIYMYARGPPYGEGCETNNIRSYVQYMYTGLKNICAYLYNIISEDDTRGLTHIRPGTGLFISLGLREKIILKK